jgi:hypothetical protein
MARLGGKSAGCHIVSMANKERPSSETIPEQSEADIPPPPSRPREIGGPKGPEPTRYGDWEVGGRCTDF